ncbi:MAG: cupredoxin domain-containing protein [Candidatus Methylomirabilales bacterium]
MMAPHRRVPPRFIAGLAAAVLTLGACAGGGGGGGVDKTPGREETFTVVGKDNVFEPKELSVPAGEEVTVELKNEGKAAHTFTVRELGVDTGIVAAGASKKVTLTAERTIPFVCTLHEVEGMVGQLVIE